MSYDLMVFDPREAPIGQKEFLDWCRDRENDEPFDPTRHEFSNAGLRSWLTDMLTVFPAMNGAYAKEDLDVDDPRLTDYGISRASIYGCFAWSQMQIAYETCFSLAEKYGIGLHDVSSRDVVVWRPDGEGVLRPAKED